MLSQQGLLACELKGRLLFLSYHGKHKISSSVVYVECTCYATSFRLTFDTATSWGDFTSASRACFRFLRNTK